MHRILRTVCVSLGALLFMACMAAGGGSGGGSPLPPSSPTPEPAVPPGAQEAVGAAKRHLAGRTGKTEEQLSVIAVEEAEWRDTSLGCPEPGMFYAQVITPGYRIILSDGEKQYEYHSDRRGNVVACSASR